MGNAHAEETALALEMQDMGQGLLSSDMGKQRAKLEYRLYSSDVSVQVFLCHCFEWTSVDTTPRTGRLNSSVASQGFLFVFVASQLFLFLFAASQVGKARELQQGAGYAVSEEVPTQVSAEEECNGTR